MCRHDNLAHVASAQHEKGFVDAWFDTADAGRLDGAHADAGDPDPRRIHLGQTLHDVHRAPGILQTLLQAAHKDLRVRDQPRLTLRSAAFGVIGLLEKQCGHPVLGQPRAEHALQIEAAVEDVHADHRRERAVTAHAQRQIEFGRHRVVRLEIGHFRRRIADVIPLMPVVTFPQQPHIGERLAVETILGRHLDTLRLLLLRGGLRARDSGSQHGRPDSSHHPDIRSSLRL